VRFPNGQHQGTAATSKQTRETVKSELSWYAFFA